MTCNDPGHGIVADSAHFPSPCGRASPLRSPWLSLTNDLAISDAPHFHHWLPRQFSAEPERLDAGAGLGSHILSRLDEEIIGLHAEEQDFVAGRQKKLQGFDLAVENLVSPPGIVEPDIRSHVFFWWKLPGENGPDSPGSVELKPAHDIHRYILSAVEIAQRQDNGRVGLRRKGAWNILMDVEIEIFRASESCRVQ